MFISSKSSFSQAILDLNHLLFPKYCVACMHPLLKTESCFCLVCTSKMPLTNYINNPDNNPVIKLFWGKAKVFYGFSMFHFNKNGPLQMAIHKLKYHKKAEIGYKLGTLLGRDIKQQFTNSEFDLIVPVPLHPKKLIVRGYNQSALIAQGLGDELGIAFSENAVIKATHNTSQTLKNRFERWENTKNVFALGNQSSNYQNKSILLVDDVITTGATLEACANLLLKNNVAKVSIATVASALRF